MGRRINLPTLSFARASRGRGALLSLSLVEAELDEVLRLTCSEKSFRFGMDADRSEENEDLRLSISSWIGYCEILSSGKALEVPALL